MVIVQILAWDPLYGIQEVEGVGPLAALTTWKEALADALWVHFIDNNGALSCLVKGGSKVSGTDTIVGWRGTSAAKSMSALGSTGSTPSQTL